MDHGPVVQVRSAAEPMMVGATRGTVGASAQMVRTEMIVLVACSCRARQWTVPLAGAACNKVRSVVDIAAGTQLQRNVRPLDSILREASADVHAILRMVQMRYQTMTSVTASRVGSHGCTLDSILPTNIPVLMQDGYRLGLAFVWRTRKL